MKSFLNEVFGFVMGFTGVMILCAVIFFSKAAINDHSLPKAVKVLLKYGPGA